MTAAMTASIFSSSVGPAVANPPASRSTSRSALATRFIAHLHRSRPRGSSPLSFSVPPHYNSRRFADSQPGRFAPRMKILVLNCGSSSVKFQYIETDLERIDRNQDRRLASGLVEKIGTPEAAASCQAGERTTRDVGLEIADHHAAIAKVVAMLQQTGALADPKEIHALGHRVVHGGDFQSSQLITAEVLKKIEEAVELAPLHNPHNLKGYTVCRELFPDRPHLAVFDTAFHHTTPPPPHPPLRLPRPLAPLRRLSLPPVGRALERRNQPHHLPPRQRLLHHRHPVRALGGHLDGLHPARGAGDGDAPGRLRPPHRLAPDGQARDDPAGSLRHAQPPQRPLRLERGVKRHAADPRERPPGPRARPPRRGRLLLPPPQVHRRLHRRARVGARAGLHRRHRRERPPRARPRLRRPELARL